MFLNSWSLALILCSFIILGLELTACGTAIRVLRFWNPDSDSNLQIRLENETWLASTLVAYGLSFQIITLILFVLAADHFCQVIVGAMCATGALLANSWGIPTLLVKLGGVFLYGHWLVLHRLDISAEDYPLVKTKYRYLLFLAPLLLVDNLLQILYIADLRPDIITSCCAVVFGEGSADTGNLLNSLDQPVLLVIFYAMVIGLTATGVPLMKNFRRRLGVLHALLWFVFFGLALVAITTVFSSYIYALPFHNCPFCILKPEYHSIGFAIYASLIAATFFGITPVAVDPYKARRSIAGQVSAYQKIAIRLSLIFLTLFTLLVSFHYVLYSIIGGES
jgi:hypothetical protein